MAGKRPNTTRQERALALVRAVHPGVASERPVPESSRRIDALLPAAPASEAWGFLREVLDRRPIVFEPFSGTPSAEELAVVLMKGACALADALARPADDARLPITLTLSVGRPQSALSVIQLLRPGRLEGLYRTREPGLEVVLVDVRNLPVGPGTSFLRAFDHTRLDGLARVLTDGTLAGGTRDAIMEAAMAHSDVFGARELELSREQLVEKGLARGRREAHLAVARALLSPDAVAELEAIDDVDALERRLLELLRGS